MADKPVCIKIRGNEQGMVEVGQHRNCTLQSVRNAYSNHFGENAIQEADGGFDVVLDVEMDQEPMDAIEWLSIGFGLPKEDFQYLD